MSPDFLRDQGAYMEYGMECSGFLGFVCTVALST